MGEENIRQGGSKCVRRAVDILDTFSFDCPRQRVIDIASKLGMTQSTASRYLSTLMEAGLLQRDENTGYYSLSYSFVKYSGIVLMNSALYQSAFSELQSLQRQTGLRTYLGIHYDDRYMCIENAGYQMPTDSYTPVGYTYPLHATAIGKIILAYMPQTRLQQAIKRDRLMPFLPNTISSESVLQRALQQVRRRGYATIQEESIPGISGLAAPIFNSERELEGAISVSDRAELMDLANREQELAKTVKHAANEISKKLGYYPYKL